MKFLPGQTVLMKQKHDVSVISEKGMTSVPPFSVDTYISFLLCFCSMQLSHQKKSRKFNVNTGKRGAGTMCWKLSRQSIWVGIR